MLKAQKKEKEKKKRERRKLNKLKKAEEAKKLGIASNSSGSSSEPDSPVMVVSDARANRAGLFAKKVYTPSSIYSYPTLGAVHETVEQMSEQQLAEELEKCRLAKTNAASPVIKGIKRKWEKWFRREFTL